MDIDEIKAQLDRIFAAGTRTSPREQASGLREALVNFKIGIGQLREALARSEQELGAARTEAADYARRGQLAAEIDDAETVRVAEQFTAKVRERVDLLERKVIVQRDELVIAERDYEATKQQYQAAARGAPLGAGPAASGSADPAAGPDQALADHHAKAAAVEAQLEHLKKKLGERK